MDFEVVKQGFLVKKVYTTTTTTRGLAENGLKARRI